MRFVQRGSAALALIEDNRWTAVERVQMADLSAWIEEKRSGAGRDPRALAIERDARGHRALSFRDALAEMKERRPPAA
eukprot:5971840-Pyramimonas_sp.AAC.1